MDSFCLHLLRHGAPERPGLLLGHTDDAPTLAGLEQCLRQSEGLDLKAVTSSDLRRCSMAAERISSAKGLHATTDPRWRELNFGDWDGMAPGQIDSQIISNFRSNPDACPPPNGERWSALVARVMEAISSLPTQSSTLVVTHAGAIRAALAGLFGFDQPRLWAFDLPYAALLSLRLWPDNAGGPLTAQIIGLRT